jgi:hypothetical protein
MNVLKDFCFPFVGIVSTATHIAGHTLKTVSGFKDMDEAMGDPFKCKVGGLGSVSSP